MHRNIQREKVRIIDSPGQRNIGADRPDPDDVFLENTELDIPAKQAITIRLDADVLDWFKRQGRGYQTRINKLLRSYMEARKNR